MKNAVEVENLSKKYTLGEREKYLTFRDMAVKMARTPIDILRGKGLKKKNVFWALDDVNFTVKPGEVVGIIGRNGAGKSTLLKILSRITEPTHGVIRLNGRMSALLEVGTGFHPELTGRDNIYLNGAILGMSRKEIDRKFDEIVEFSGVERFLDMPTKRYSSGMQVRLAFSVAAHLEPDILIIDEVLAVGDAEFQKKCLGKMDEVTKKEGRTILFVSHDMGAIRRICNRVIVLDEGKIAFEGDVAKGIEYYFNDKKINDPIVNFVEKKENPNRKLKLKRAFLTDDKGVKRTVFDYKEKVVLNVDFDIYTELKNYLVSFELYNTEGICIMSSTSRDKAGNLNITTKPGQYQYRVEIDSELFTKPATYFFKFASAVPKVEHLDSPDETLFFEVRDGGKTPSYLLGHGRKGVIEPILNWEEHKL